MNDDRRDFLRACAWAGVAASPILGGAAAQLYVQHRRPPTESALLRLKARFPAFRGTDSGELYLDSAATTHRPQDVLDAMLRFYVEDNANPAPVHARARRAAERLADARAAVAHFLNAPDPLEVVFARGTTEAVNLAASSWGTANIHAGDEIVVTISEHYSNLLPWLTVARKAGATVHVVDVDDAGCLRRDQLDQFLSTRTRLVAFSHVSNVLGIVNPVKDIVAASRHAGARVFIDGAQGAPHVGVDVQSLDCDFYAFSGHKMCGPMGTGVLWARRELLEAMPPYHVGSNMAHGVDLVNEPTFERGALKFQAGTPDVAGPVGLAAAVRFLESFGREALWAHDQALVERARPRLEAIRGLKMIGEITASPRVPVFSFTLDGWTVPELAAALDMRGMCVRGGDLAALPLLKRFGVSEALRASAYFYTGAEDLERFANTLESLVTGRRG